MSERDRSGGVVAEIFCGLLALVGAILTLLAASVAIQRYRAGGDAGILAVILIPFLFMAAFGGITLLLHLQRRQDGVIAERRALNPDQPWLWTDKWRDGRFRAESSWGPAVALGVFAAFWNGMVGAAAWGLSLQGALAAPQPVIFLLIFGVVGLGLIGAAVYVVLLARKYPPALFEMSAVPGVLGGHLLGWVHVPAKVPPGTGAKVDLSCTRRSTGTSRSSQSVTLWRDEVAVPITADSLLPVAFTIPFDLPPSELPERAGRPSGSLISWTLSVTASVPGVDYSEVFNVPVFATPASDPSIVAGVVDLAVQAGRPADAKASLVESGPGQTVFDLQPAKGLGCGLSAFLVLPIAAWPIARYAGLDLPSALVASEIALAVGAGTLALFGLGVALTATRIQIDSEAIRVPHGRWPIRWLRTIPIADVTEVRYASGESQRVDVLTRQGGNYTVSGNMSGPEEAKWLAAEVARAVERHRGSTVSST